jgi:hypothetical protein
VRGDTSVATWLTSRRRFFTERRLTHTFGMQAYTEIGSENYFKTRWSSVKTSLGHARRVTRAKDENCASTVSIGGYTTAFCIAVLQHQFEPLPEERE